jgi:hypothetical protein
MSVLAFMSHFLCFESERLNAIKKAVTQLIERGVLGKLERTSIDPGAQRKEQSGFFLGGHYRDGNGRFRILSGGKSLTDLRIYRPRGSKYKRRASRRIAGEKP